ncbi:transmembrane protein, putative (macronuclear) [Tetrahymena thermophila SB210]|uniref:Transmembrane protein, putative n=1 Tax=Tetrahymena thermophila (strain SB210) TaxID=312017 RepID=I7M362_TETTS|nr:transmembrane protein, putative [Tetrahymena thermophila SB210]EAS02411.2 transmembrane protein, putative [Tetrahymena thermophila SB210]|eukprot:XP_001022656.2 transmembrane protein, putative [Tetrahymena thermophila SB210]
MNSNSNQKPDGQILKKQATLQRLNSRINEQFIKSKLLQMKNDYKQKKFHNQIPSRSILICQDEQDNLRSFFVQNSANIDNKIEEKEKYVGEIQNFISVDDKNNEEYEEDISDVESNKDDNQDDFIQESQLISDKAEKEYLEECQLGQIKLKQIESVALNEKIYDNNKEKETDQLTNNEKSLQLRNKLSGSKTNIIQKQQHNDEQNIQLPQQNNLSQTKQQQSGQMKNSTINQKKLIEFNIKIIMKNQKQDKNLILEYGDFLDLIEEVTFENIRTINVFKILKVFQRIKILRVVYSIFDINSCRQYIFDCKNYLENIFFLRSSPAVFSSRIFKKADQIENITRESAMFIMFQQDYLKIQYIEQIDQIVLDLLELNTFQSVRIIQNYNPLILVDYQQLLGEYRQLILQNTNEEDQKSKNTLQDFEEDQYLSRLEEGTADFYNYLFLDIKNEESLNDEEKNQLKQIKFYKSVSSIEQDIFRKKKFDSFVIEKRFSSKKNPKKVKTRIELIINKFHFEDIPSFIYLTTIIDQYSSIITSIKFMRLGRIKDNLFSMLFQKLRDLDRIQVLLFYDTALYPQNLEEIKLFMNWQLGKVKKIGFVQNFLNQLDLNFLFDTSLTKYPRNNQQLNDIYFLKYFNSNLVKSYSLIMIDQNYISQNLQSLVQQNLKPISQKGIYYNPNLGYDFKFNQAKLETLDLKTQWLSIKHSIENDQIEDLQIEYYNDFLIDNKNEVGHNFDLTIYSRKSLKDIDINLIYFNINQVERVLSLRNKIGMYCLKILSNIDNYLKNLKLRDLLVQKYVGSTLTIVNLDILFVPTLENISLFLQSEIAQLSQGLNKCAPYLKRFKISGDVGQLIPMNNLLKGVDWSKFKQLQKIIFSRCNFDEESLFELFNSLNDTSLEKIKLVSIKCSEKFLYAIDWKRFKQINFIELTSVIFNIKNDNKSFYVTDICEPIAHQLKTLNFNRINIPQHYLGAFNPSKYTNLTSFKASKFFQNYQNMLQMVNIKQLQQKNDNGEKQKKDENANQKKNIELSNQNNTQKNDTNNQEGNEEEEEVLDHEQKTAKIYQKIQNQIIKDAIKEDDKKQLFVQKQDELTDQIVYKSFDRISIKLNSDYIFSQYNCENVDLKYLDMCVKSINLTTLSPSQLTNYDQKIIFSKLQNVEEIFCWQNFNDKEAKKHNSQLESIINQLSNQLKVLDLRRSSISLVKIFDSQNQKQFSQLKILKVTRSFFFSFKRIQAFIDRISSTIECIEILNITESQQNQTKKDNQIIDFSKLVNLRTFIIHDSINNQVQKPLQTLPKQIQNLKLFSLKQNLDFLQINEFKQLTNLTISNNQNLIQKNKSFFDQKNKSIKFLCLKNNSLRMQQLENLKINNLENLETLILNHNPLYKDNLDNYASFFNSEESFDSLKQEEIFQGENQYASDQEEEESNTDEDEEEDDDDDHDEQEEDDDDDEEEEEEDSENEENESQYEDSEINSDEENSEEDEERSGEDSSQDLSIKKKKKVQKKQNKQKKLKKMKISKQNKNVNPKKSGFKFFQILESFKSSLINLCMRNCNITEEIFDKVDFTNFKQLSKLDISRNNNFFLQNKQIFKNMLNQISWNLQELNVGQTNICLENNLSNFDFTKLQKLSIFKAKWALKIFKSSQSNQTFQSKEALLFMNAIISQLSQIQLTELVIGANWQQASKLKFLDISNMNLEKFLEVQRRDQVIELQKLIQNVGKRLEVLNMNQLMIQAQELEMINWQNLINLKLLNISNIDCFEQNFHIIGKITEKMIKLEQMILKDEGIEEQILTLPWKNFSNIRKVILEKDQQTNIYYYSFQNNIFKSYLKNDYSFAMMPLQLFNARILNPSHAYYQQYLKLQNEKEDFSNKNHLNRLEQNQQKTLILDRIKYNFPFQPLSEIDEKYASQMSYSTYGMVMWNLVRFDILLKADLNQLQKILSQQAFNQKIIYFNNINCYLFFIFSKINDESFLGLILNSYLLESNQIETVFIQQLNDDKFFYSGSINISVIYKLMDIFFNRPTKRIILSYSLNLNRNQIMNELTSSSQKESLYEEEQFSSSFQENLDQNSQKFDKIVELNRNLNFINEYTMLDFLNFAPSQELNLSNYSIQFFKYLYLIQMYSPYSYKTTINYSIDSLSNNSISARLLKILYQRGKNGKLYKFLNLFYQDTTFYKFDESVILLNTKLSLSKENIFLKQLMLFMIPIYYFICIFGPLYFTYRQDLIDSCGKGLSWHSYYVYLAFAIISFLMEYSLYSKILSTTSHLIPAASITPSTSLIGILLSEIKKVINQNRSYLYIFSLASSQITRYNYFTDIGFIVSCYQCQRPKLMIASIVFVGLHTLINLIYYILLLFQKSKKFLIPTSEIDKFYQISTLLEFHAVSDTLDLISPSNVVVFPVFLRKISLFRLRTIAGIAFNGRIYNAIQRFLLEDFPQLIIQIIFLILENKANINIILSFVATIVTLLISMYKFLSIRPSTINQLDFDFLNQTKKENSWKFEKKIHQLSKKTNQNIIDNIKKLNRNTEYSQILNDFYKFNQLD